MKPRRIATSTLLALGLLAGGAGAARAQNSIAAGVHIGPSGRTSVDIGFFHDDLAPYGRWVDRSAYGEVFVPRGVPAGWRPYTRGHWVYTDYGWTWASSESFGWATYHYGRWTYDSGYGWVWVPGTEWGPAWVDWQEGDNYVGWAPLPPTVGYDARYGIDTGGFEVGVDLAPSAFVFVPERSFLVSDVSSYCLPSQQNVRFFNRTRNITQYSVVNNRIFNRGLPLATVERVTGRRVSRYQVADLGRAGARQRFQGNRASFFRPVVNAGNARTAERIAAQSRRANSPVRQAVRQGAAAQLAAVQGRRAVQAGRQAAVNQRQAARLQAVNARERQQVQAQGQRQRVAQRAQEQRQQQARAQGQRERIAGRAQAQRQQIARRAEVQRGNERARAQAQRQQIAARGQAERQNQRVQANAARQQQRVQASRNQAARNQQRAQVQSQRRQQQAQAARAQARPQRQQQQRPQVAQRQQQRQQVAQRQRQQPPQHGKPRDNSGGPSQQRRAHGGF